MLPNPKILAHSIKNPFANLDDQVCFFGDRNEVRWINNAPFRQLPPHECLGPANLAGLQVVLWLVMYEQLVTFERSLEFALGHQALNSSLVHRRSVVRENITAFLLGVIKRRIGIAKQVNDVWCILGTAGNAHARGHEYFVPLNKKRLCKAIKHTLSQLVQLRFDQVLTCKAVNDNCKFVASQTTDDRSVGEHRGQTLRNCFKSRVAGKMTKGVVDVLEMIDIDVEKTKCLLAAASTRNGSLQQVLELHPVRYFCKRVDARKISNPPLGTPAFGDVLRGNYAVFRIDVVAADERGGV